MRKWTPSWAAYVLCLSGLLQSGYGAAEPTAEQPLIVDTKKKEIQIYGVMYPERFNAAQGEQAHYHVLVWQKGKAPNALIETPADDLDFHAALVKIGATPGDNLGMESWTERKDDDSVASHERVTGSALDVRIAWNGNPTGSSIEQVFRSSETPDSRLQTLDSRLDWRFGGNHDRLFNKFPALSRPGCLVCLYSCPSGKVSNATLSIHDYVTFPSHFTAHTAILPPDGTPVILTFRPLSHEHHE